MAQITLPPQASIETLAHEGALAGRYNLTGAEGNNDFVVEAVLGTLTGEVGFDDEFGAHTVNIERAARVETTYQYDGVGVKRTFEVGKDVRVTDGRGRSILLRGRVCVDRASIDKAIGQLTDNEAFAAAGYKWEVSIIGFSALMALQLALAEATHIDLTSKMGLTRLLTDPEMRADRVAGVGTRTLGALLTFQPTN